MTAYLIFIAYLLASVGGIYGVIRWLHHLEEGHKACYFESADELSREGRP